MDLRIVFLILGVILAGCCHSAPEKKSGEAPGAALLVESPIFCPAMYTTPHPPSPICCAVQSEAPETAVQAEWVESTNSPEPIFIPWGKDTNPDGSLLKPITKLTGGAKSQ